MQVVNILLLIAAIPALVLAQCSNPVVKKDWNALSSSEKQSYMNAIKNLMGRNPIGVKRMDQPQNMAYVDFTDLHVSAARYVHGTQQFYPFHRAMMWAWDQAVISAGARYDDGSPMASPYWDWSRDSQNFRRASMFTNQYLGTTGSFNSPCLPDGIQGSNSNFRPFLSGRPYQDSCLRRVMMDLSLYDTNGVINALQSKTNYDQFRQGTEGMWHANIHYVVGGWTGEYNSYGDMSDGAYSPNDATFYFHHNMIDRIWWKWQEGCEKNFNDYSGKLDDGVTLFPQFKVKDVIDIENGPLCYTYAKDFNDFEVNFDGCRRRQPGGNGGGGPSSTPPPVVVTSTDDSGNVVTKTEDPTPTSTDSTSATATQTSALDFEKVWFQGILQGLIQAKFSFNPAVFVRRDYAGYPIDLPSTKSTIPSTSAGPKYSVDSISGAPTLPATKTVAYTTSSMFAPDYKPTLKTSCGFIQEVYAPPSVKLAGQDIPIPEGHKILYKDDYVVKVVPMDFYFNTTTGETNYRGIMPKAIYPDRGPAPSYTPTNPKCTPPPTPHPTALSYPAMPDKSYYDKMGWDYYNAAVEFNKAKEFVDRCNCDESCLSPAANSLREAEREAEKKAEKKKKCKSKKY
ncbi:hypothetical protein HDU97_009856 [Phlyctochytrium planicorne]|nr:hypothetical protein HDU97_009856 [Phlyctochytrium planicorne]